LYQASDAAPGHLLRQRVTAPVRGVPVYVMLPLDTVWLVDRGRGAAPEPVLLREKAMEVGLEMLCAAGVEGVMVDVWWGIAEHAGPRRYDFSAYRRLFEQVASKGLKVQAVMSFHAAGGNVGDTCTIPLPPWVMDAGVADPDIFFTDRAGHRNLECLSLGCDDARVLAGRTPVEAYSDFVGAFADEFAHMFGDVVSEVTVGLGPAGELRYPAYPEGDGRWRFPGVGEFQCFDRYMLAGLQSVAEAVGRPEWGHGGPHDAGGYNSREWETGFFLNDGGSFDSEYGRFFLSWYSGALAAHADRVLGAARAALSAPGRPRLVREVREHGGGGVTYAFDPAVRLGVKLAGVHWWFKSRAHAAELTAGYYNTRDRNGYAPIMEVLARHGAGGSFTCVEMRDCEHPTEGRCSPEGLLNQVLATAARAGVAMSGENALQRYDPYAFDKIAESAFGQSVMAGQLEKLTFLRMGDMMVDNWDAFSAFLRRLTCPPDHYRR
jgi:beta-amylase